MDNYIRIILKNRKSPNFVVQSGMKRALPTNLTKNQPGKPGTILRPLPCDATNSDLSKNHACKFSYRETKSDWHRFFSESLRAKNLDGGKRERKERKGKEILERILSFSDF